MKIIRSTSSHASAGRRDETRETMRSGAIQAKGVSLPDDDGLSLNPARGELVSASLNRYRRPSSQETPSLPLTDKQRIGASVRPVGVRGVGADQKNDHVTWETRLAAALSGNRCWEFITIGRGLGRESDGLVVARKSRKAGWSQGALLQTRQHQ